MGLLGFLSRKTSNDAASKSSLTSWRYDSTVAAEPPIRGNLPVVGNGPDIMEELERAARKRSQSHLSATRPTSSFGGYRTPSERRPSVSTVDDGASLQSAARTDGGDVRKPRGLRPRLLSQRSTSSADRRFLDSYSVNGDIPPVPTIPSHHSREGSIMSSQSQSRRAHVDLLDAQGQFRPSNFRSRLEASGARDYGEDVAERNIGPCGPDSPAPTVTSFKSLPAKMKKINEAEAHGIDSSDVSLPVTNGHSNAEAETTPALPKGDVGRARRASLYAQKEVQRQHKAPPVSSLNVSKRSTKPTDATTDGKSPHKAERENANQSPGRHNANSSSKRKKSKPLSIGSESDAAFPPSVPRFRNGEKSQGPSVPSPSVPSPRPRDSVLVAKVRQDDVSAPTHSRRSSLGGAAQSATEEPLEPVIQELHDGDSGYHPSFAPEHEEAGEPTKRSPILDPDEFIFVHNREPPLKRPETHHGWSGAHGSSARDPYGYTSRPSSSSSAYHFHNRNRSFGGTSLVSRSQLDDISEHIPARTSSLAQSNGSVMTPTTTSSGLSDHPFPRSNHTANTSVDIPPSVPSLKSGHIREVSDSVTSSARRRSSSAYVTAAEDSASVTMSPRKQFEKAQQQYNGLGEGNDFMDAFDRLSTDGSDVDSFMEKMRRRRQQQKVRGEEALLFEEGRYGSSLGALPGLYDDMEGTSTSDWGKLSATPATFSPRSDSMSHHALRSSRRKSQQLSHARRNYIDDDESDYERGYDTETDGSDDGSLSSDIDISRAQALLTLAALGGADIPKRLDLLRAMLEQNAEQAEGTSALQRRKEAKMKKRTLQHEKRQGKKPMRRGQIETASSPGRH